MCGAYSALGLAAAERELWPLLRERLRRPGHLMAVMRGVLGSDAEVGVVSAVTPAGVVQPLAVLATPVIADEVQLDPEDEGALQRRGRIADYPVEVLMTDDGRPAGILMTPWLFENLSLYSRKLWSRR